MERSDLKTCTVYNTPMHYYKTVVQMYNKTNGVIGLAVSITVACWMLWISNCFNYHYIQNVKNLFTVQLASCGFVHLHCKICC